MGLTCGHYRTAAGSEMWVYGEHCGKSAVEFDWLEEGGCMDCQPCAYDVDGMLVWHCDECGGGAAELMPVTPNGQVTGRPPHWRRKGEGA